MTTPTPQWEQRIAALWAAIDEYEPEDFRARVGALADELPAGHPVGWFELASANDSTGLGDVAAPLYRKALEAGLTGYRRRRTSVQLGSTLRNLGSLEDSLALLTAERERDPAELDEATAGLSDAVDAFLALTLADAGREREALTLALGALSRHLPRYNRSLTYYAKALSEDMG
ncbi:tetratricopeptide repeat protein [Streptomyces sp. NBC_00503]|uniref:tetratricopeptide repeat protein n=1 Tax=Streptomyces sp. NBC_00503 TaxID=2903659 RepID=UPI002E8090E1|nr:tetratricopeptide repeat protein [Streptomyces sp. NBC_00503]WUD86400.1 tetratricopeptide repeat protein [Streptomyces sp. NBC_00503]